MALVDYTSSDESENNVDSIKLDPSPAIISHHLKRKRSVPDTALPPLPSQFHDLYASTTRASTRDDPSLHGGRKRATPHVEGNWPSHLYIEWYPQPAEHDALTQLIASIQIQEPGVTRDPDVDAGRSKTTSFLISDLGTPLPLHISLSRPIGFKTEEKDGFVSALQRRIAGAGVRPFEVQPRGLDWVPNFDATRWFLVLRLRRPPGNGLNKLLRVCNAVVEEWGQGGLYTQQPAQHREARDGKKKSKTGVASTLSTGEDEEEVNDLSDSFHISVAWTLDAPSPAAVEYARARSKGDFFKEVQDITFTVEEVKVKVGNVVTTVKLPVKIAEVPNLFGL